jgi:hypothetical protein
MKMTQLIVVLLAIIFAVGVHMYSETQAVGLVSTIIAVMVASQSQKIANYLGGKK